MVVVPLLSLPGLVRTTLANIPADVPYLQAEPELISFWQKELEPLGGFKIGIMWNGNPKFGGNQLRSIPLEHFEPLARVPGVRLVSLQMGPGSEQARSLAGRFPILDLSDKLDKAAPFIDSAAVMKNLDLVVSCCTSGPHLAGALGVRVWTVLPLVADWRWLLEREDYPWYPTMRLFRQKRFGDWNEVFERVVAEVKKEVLTPDS